MLQVKETWQEPKQTSLALKCCLREGSRQSLRLLPWHFSPTNAARSAEPKLSSGLRKLDTSLTAAKQSPLLAQGPTPGCVAQSWRFHHCIQKNHHPKAQNHFFFKYLTRFWQQEPCLLQQKFLQFIQFRSFRTGKLIGSWKKLEKAYFPYPKIMTKLWENEVC